jgi:hypothetical protein
MRRVVTGLSVLLLASVLFAGLGSAAAAGSKKLVEGTVYNTTCAGTTCGGCPPPCGPIAVPQSRTDIVCAQAQRRIVCPLAQSSGTKVAPDFCILGEPCGVSFPIYSGEGAVVTVRKRGSSTAQATLPIVEGHFKIRLAPGEYVIRPFPPEMQCWSGEPTTIKVTSKLKSPVPATVNVSNGCVAHPD